MLSGFELYPRWVPLTGLISQGLEGTLGGQKCDLQGRTYT